MKRVIGILELVVMPLGWLVAVAVLANLVFWVLGLYG